MYSNFKEIIGAIVVAILIGLTGCTAGTADQESSANVSPTLVDEKLTQENELSASAKKQGSPNPIRQQRTELKGRALTHMGVRELSEAKIALKQAINLSQTDNDADVRLLLSTVLMELNDDSAINELEIVLERVNSGQFHSSELSNATWLIRTYDFASAKDRSDIADSILLRMDDVQYPQLPSGVRFPTDGPHKNSLVRTLCMFVHSRFGYVSIESPEIQSAISRIFTLAPRNPFALLSLSELAARHRDQEFFASTYARLVELHSADESIVRGIVRVKSYAAAGGLTVN